MVNKREKVYVTISISYKRLSSFFYPFPITLFFFSPYLFRLILLYLNGTCNFFLPAYLDEFFFLIWTFLRGNFFRWGGGGARGTQCTPCVRASLFTYVLTCFLSYSLTHSLTLFFRIYGPDGYLLSTSQISSYKIQI